jgi:hypothetical protein
LAPAYEFVAGNYNIERGAALKHIRDYRNERNLMHRPLGVMVIDLFGLYDDEVRLRFPEVYQHLVLQVKERKDPEVNRIGRDANKRGYRKENWWLFGENNPDLRRALYGLGRYIVTVETAKHRTFQFLSGSILPDNMLTAIASADAFHLGVLSSGIQVTGRGLAEARSKIGRDPRNLFVSIRPRFRTRRKCSGDYRRGGATCRPRDSRALPRRNAGRTDPWLRP